MVRAFEESVKDAKSAIDLSELKRAIEEKDRDVIMRIIEDVSNAFGATANATFPPRFLDTMVDGGVTSGLTAKTEGTYKTAQVTLAFDRKNPLAVAWARDNAGVLVEGVTSETKKGLSEIMARAFEEGIPPGAAARLIRNSVGLSEKGATAVANARSRLEKAKPGSLVKLGRKKYRIPAGGLPSKKIDGFLGKYSEKLLNDRAKLIARTETIAAANEGQRQLWLQADKQGLLAGTELREWIVTPDDRLCEICEAMEGQLRGLRDEFYSPTTGETAIGPPIHPDCRCAVGLTDKTEAEVREQIEKQGVQSVGKGVCDGSPEWCPPKQKAPDDSRDIIKNHEAQADDVRAMGLSYEESIQGNRFLLREFGDLEDIALNTPTLDDRGYQKQLIERNLADRMKGKWDNGTLKQFLADIAEFEEFKVDPEEYAGTIKNLVKVADPDSSRRIKFAYKLVEESVDEEEWLLRQVTGRLTNQWAHTSGDAEPLSIALQMGAREEFGLQTTSQFDHLLTHMKAARIVEKVEGFYDEYDDVIRDYLRAMYANTQEQLAEEGITHITMYRGMEIAHFDPGLISADLLEDAGYAVIKDKVGLQPMSSFSTSIDVAHTFATENSGQIMATRVPAESIISSSRTGFGCLSEGEFVVLGDQEFVSTVAFGDAYESGQGLGFLKSVGAAIDGDEAIVFLDEEIVQLLHHLGVGRK